MPLCLQQQQRRARHLQLSGLQPQTAAKDPLLPRQDQSSPILYVICCYPAFSPRVILDCLLGALIRPIDDQRPTTPFLRFARAPL